MKWSDLSFKEKKQIYDSIKAQNPDATYLDIKSQFDSIPAYEDDRLVPMEWLLPTIGLGGAEFLREKQNNKSN